MAAAMPRLVTTLLRPATVQTFVGLGVLVGLFEAVAVVRYDWLMDDWALGRLALGLAWAAAIVAVDVLGWLALGFVARWRLLPAVAGGTALVFFTRMVRGDRFEVESAVAGIAAVLFAVVALRVPQVLGLVAASIGLVGLWARVPLYTTPWLARLEFWLPGVVLTVAVGALCMGGGTARQRGRWLTAAGLVLAAVGVGTVAHHKTPAATRAPSVLFVLVDTLRTDHVAPYGDRATPSTARLASEGVTFTDAITVIPKTTQSVAAFQTARYPVTSNVRVLASRLPPAETTLAEHLSDQGYRTGAVVHNAWVRRGKGFEQGFEQFWSFFEIERAYGPLRLTGFVAALDTLTLQRIRPFSADTNAADTTDRAIAWLDETPDDEAFYLYLHYFDPHWPYRPPGHDPDCVVNHIHESDISRGDMIFNNPLPDAENERAIELYGYEVDHNLDQVGRLLDWLDDNERADDTVVVFTADHGHHLGDHGYWYHHGEFLYEPGVRIPMLLRYPDGLPAGVTEDLQFRSIDLGPTVLDLVGATPLPDSDGLALRVLREDGAPPAFLETDVSYFKSNKRRYIRSRAGKVRGVRDGRWKLHFTPKKGGGVWELFDLETDPDELQNLLKRGQSGGVPDGVDLDEMMQVLRDHIPPSELAELERVGHDLSRPPTSRSPGQGRSAGVARERVEADVDAEPELSDDDKGMLEALGYMDSPGDR
jgi:arylsulfatase A-like enzyme